MDRIETVNIKKNYIELLYRGRAGIESQIFPVKEYPGLLPPALLAIEAEVSSQIKRIFWEEARGLLL